MQYGMFKKEKSTDWKWYLKDLEKVSKNGLKVFSCFACGGGSSMGYKLAGCEVLGCNEIDKSVNQIYVKNLKPKYNFCEDIRDFNKREDLPKELYELDILDGSPPCSTFSMAGQREKSWGVKKKFREGQTKQILDDLLFVFVETVDNLKPKVAIMENVEGLIFGSSWQYVQQIYKRFNEIGYKVKHWLLKAEIMGVPQTRHRVFFIATRLDFDLSKIDMGFDYEEITFKTLKSLKGLPLSDKRLKTKILIDNAKYGDYDLSSSSIRLYNKNSFFNSKLLYDDKVVPTLRAGVADYYRFGKHEQITQEEIINISTFPQNYNFGSNALSNVCFICGMSVPPIMIKRIVIRLIESQIFSSEVKL